METKQQLVKGHEVNGHIHLSVDGGWQHCISVRTENCDGSEKVPEGYAIADRILLTWNAHEELAAALEESLELAQEGFNAIHFEVKNKVQGSMYNADDVEDARQVLGRISTALSKARGQA